MRGTLMFGLLVAVSLLGAVQTAAEPISALTTGNSLITFDSASPGTVSTGVPVSGLSGSESLLGIDFVRPPGSSSGSAI